MKYLLGGFSVLLFPLRLRAALLCVAILLIASGAVPAKDDFKLLSPETQRQVKDVDKLVRAGEHVTAEKLLREIVRLNPANTAARLRLAYLLLKLKNLPEAYMLSYDIAIADPKNARALSVLGMTLLHTGNFPVADKMLNTALEIDETQALAWAGLGLLNFYENRPDYAMNCLQHAVYFDSREPDFFLALAQIASRAEKYKEAAAAYNEFLSVSPKTDKERRDRIKGLISFLGFLGGKRSLYMVGGKDRTSVDIELVRDRPVLSIKINKSNEIFKFVLDTGSGISVISNNTATKLGIKPVVKNGGRARAIGGDGTFPIVYGFLERVRVGEAEIQSVPVYIRNFHQNDEHIDGYIGLSLISKFLTTLDYGAKSFTLVRKDSTDERDEDRNPSMFLPLRLTTSGFLSGEVILEGLGDPLNFIVDTGASISVISQDIAKKKEISPFALTQKMRVVGAAGVTEDVPSFLLPRVSFGDNSLEKITAIALDLDLINEASGFQQAGILGGNFLKNYRLTFDFKNSKVIFKPLK